MPESSNVEPARDSWDPDRYHQFRAERRAPFDDLVAMLRPVPRGALVDLGCGTGELTVEAAFALGTTTTVGIDSSAAMLDRASQLSAANMDLTFVSGDIARFGTSPTDGSWDVVLSNAALQWVPDHTSVLARWRSALRPHGQIAVQVPANVEHPSHTTISEVLSEQEFAEHAGDVPNDPVRSVLDPARYAEVLFDLGAPNPLVRLQVYGMAMRDAAQVVEWTSGTALTRVQRVLPGEVFDRFVERYRERLLERLGHESPYYYAFKRILMVATFP